jgi:ribose transport system substrate-binding protein
MMARHSLLTLLALVLALLTGCSESDADRIARIEKATATAKAAEMADASAAPGARSLTPEEMLASDATKKLVIYCATDLRDPFQKVQSDLMHAAVRTLIGYRYKVLDAAGTIDGQQAILEQARTEHPAWLMVSVVEDTLSLSLIENMRRQGTMVVGLDQRLSATITDTRSGTDQAQIGRLAGQLVVQALRRKAAAEGKPQVTGRVLQITGMEDSYSTQARSAAFTEALKPEPGIILVHEGPGDCTAAGATIILQDALRLQGSIDVIFAHNDIMALAASQACATAGVRENIFIIGVDAMGYKGGGLDMMIDHRIDATIWQPMPLEMAFLALRSSLADGYKLLPSYERAPEIVTQRNLNTVLKKLRNLGQ